MNLKAYLRGIGAGMIVSALVIGVGRATAPKPSEPIDKSTLKTSVSSVVSVSETSEDKESKDTDPESDIKTSTVSSAGTEGSDNEKETETPGEGVPSDKEEGNTEPAASTETSASTENSASTDTEPSEEKKDTETNSSADTGASSEGDSETDEGEDSDEYVTITIVKGDSSVRAARKLFEAGLVESAVEFDKYLCENGYDKSISVGTYKIKPGSDFEDMAKTITRRK